MFPSLFRIGSFTVYSYGFFVALAVLTAYFLTTSRAGRYGFSSETVTNLVLLIFVTGVVGARAAYVLQHPEAYRGNWLQAFSVHEGGLVWYGGFIFSLLAGFFYASYHRLPALGLLDFFAPLAALTHAIGRVGCFFNGCCFGKFTASRFGITAPGESMARIPVQLYESAFLLVLSLGLFFLLTKKHREGAVFLGYVAAYGAARFFLEFFRGDQLRLYSLTIPQWWSLFFIAASAVCFFLLKKSAQCPK